MDRPIRCSALKPEREELKMSQIYGLKRRMGEHKTLLMANHIQCSDLKSVTAEYLALLFDI
jgi:hypothetical protein